MSLLNVILLPGATGHSIPGISPTGCGSASGGWRAVSHQARLVFCALLMPCCPEGNVIASPACQASLPPLCLLWLGTVLFLYPIPTAIHAAEGWWWWGVKRLPQVHQHQNFVLKTEQVNTTFLSVPWFSLLLSKSSWKKNLYYELQNNFNLDFIFLKMKHFPILI